MGKGGRPYVERTYRSLTPSGPWVGFEVRVKETDLLIKAYRDLTTKAMDAVLTYRNQLEAYISRHPVFRETLEPYPSDPLAPVLVREMIEASRAAGVGPMAAVAGAIAQFVGKDLCHYSEGVLVENGGDLFLRSPEDLVVGVFAGRSPLSGRIGIRIPHGETPLGIGTSSGTVGPSFSLGRADAACVVADSAPLADAVATAVGNLVRSPADMERAAEFAGRISGVRGVLIVIGDSLLAWGRMELVPLEKGNRTD